jgi:nucleoside 2-deoxyribosyltransferase
LLAGELRADANKLTDRQRAALAHSLQSANREGQVPFIKSDWLARFLEEDPRLPTPATQATNILRFVGDEVLRTGEPMDELPVNLATAAGSPNAEFARALAKELATRGYLAGVDASSMSGTQLLGVSLTLQGWQQHEAERRGKTAGNYGFVALRFGNAALDALLKETVKPAIRANIGYDLVDMRDVATAGVIDNIMRAQIRDAAFVLADLTDDNLGAYWEAGFAEGLGKPVIYLCEAAKFAEARTHFDTNHCTTVMWTVSDADHFAAELIATLRRSLNLFPSS